MLKTLKAVVGAIPLTFLLSCGQSDAPSYDPLTARQFVREQAIAECDSAIDAYIDVVGDDYDFNGLKEIFREYIDKYPHSTALQRSYQDLYLRYEMNDEIEEFYRSMHNSNPESAMYAYLYARVASGESEKERLFRLATELDPGFFWGWYGLAATLSSEPFADTMEAIACYKNAITADNSQPSAFRYVGKLYEDIGVLDTALIFYGLLRSTRPHDVGSLLPRIDLLRKMQRYQQAETELAEFLIDSPDDLFAQMEMADILAEQGKFERAISLLNKLTEVSKEPYHKLMVTYCKFDKPDSSLEVARTALAAGYDDYRTVLYDPQLADMRRMRGFAEIRESVEDSIAARRAVREEQRKMDRATRKKEVLEETLDDPAPEFSLVNLTGDTVTLSELRGSVVVLDFWATWCGPCRLTMPLLQEFHDARGDEIEYFSVNVWERDTTEVRPYLLKYGYSFDCLFGSAQTASDYSVKGIPTLIMIDQNGRIRFRHSGYRPDMDEVLNWHLDELLGKSG